MGDENAARALILLSELAIALQKRYDRMGSPSDLEWSIQLNTVALARRPPGHEDRSVSLLNLSIALSCRYEKTGSGSDFKRAINLLSEATTSNTSGRRDHNTLDDFLRTANVLHHRARSKHAQVLLNNLAVALMNRYDEMGSRRDLEWAGELNTAALLLRPPGHILRGSSLSNLANVFIARYDRMGTVNDLERAIELYSEALTLRGPGHGYRGESLNNLAWALRTRYDRTNNMEDLERAIELYTEALALCPPGHGRRRACLDKLALVLSTRHDNMGTLKDLERAFELASEALALCPPAHKDRGSCLNNLAYVLSRRYGGTGGLADLDRAIELHTEALTRRPPGHKLRCSSLSNLANALSTRYDGMGTVSDLERVIELHSEALALRLPGHGDRGSSLDSLAVVLGKRYDGMGHLADLERVVKLHTEALAHRPPGHKFRCSSLNRLANTLSTRYDRAGTVNDLERAIELHSEALALHPLGHRDRGLSLNNLAIAMRFRYDKMGNLTDLERAIELSSEALKHQPPGLKHRGSSLNNLASALGTRYDRIGTVNDLERAIELHSEALALHPPGHEDHGPSLNNLAVVLNARYNKTSNSADLEKAIELFTKALELAPQIAGQRGRGGPLKNLANAFSTRYEDTGSPADLKRSIELYTKALAQFPPGDMRRATTLADLSSALWRMESYPKYKIFELLKEGSEDHFSSLDSCLQCALRLVQYRREVGDHENVINAYDNVIGLLQHRLPIWPTVKFQYDALLAQFRILRLPMDAAAYAVGIGNVERAVELLDAGRSLVWSGLRRFSEPLLQSKRLDKKLAEDFEAVCFELQNISTAEARFDNPLASNLFNQEDRTTGISYDVLMCRKRELMERYNSQLLCIKDTPGFEGFLERSSFKELQLAAVEGPIIIVNCSEYGSQVIIVFADRPPSLIQLDGSFRETALRMYIKLLKNTVIQFSPELLCRDLKEMAKFLWDEVVGDIVKKLRAAGVPIGSRVWWCPTAFLNALPFHAAGNKDCSLGDFYVSSYTPTLKALVDSRKPSLSSVLDVGGLKSNPSILVVAQTQESSKLQSARKELDILRDLGTAVECLDQEKATSKAVLEHLQFHTCNWAHFICHGKLLPNPFESSLVLHGGNLSFNDIIKARLPDAKFAFLAACHTAEQFPSRLPDEVLHLAAAMYFTGFRSVVGTMWSMRDEDGPEVARTFYEEILREDDTSEKPMHTRAAQALWKATKKLKETRVLNEKGKEVPIGMDRWVNFIHIGA